MNRSAIREATFKYLYSSEIQKDVEENQIARPHKLRKSYLLSSIIHAIILIKKRDIIGFLLIVGQIKSCLRKL